MSSIHKVAFYLVDAIGWHDKDGIESKIANVFGGNDLRQVHIETSEYFALRNGDSECEKNCDLADLEKHFNHDNVAGEVVVGGVYKHFKGHEVKVLAVSIGTEYGEKVVVYEHLGDHTIWHRPIGMFCSSVDREKYPDVQQKHRFELVR